MMVRLHQLYIFHKFRIFAGQVRGRLRREPRGGGESGHRAGDPELVTEAEGGPDEGRAGENSQTAKGGEGE